VRLRFTTAVLFSLLTPLAGMSQKYSLEKSSVVFFSEATIENIEATNIKSASIFNATTSEIVFSIPIAEFEFEKSLMKEHFNETYLESEKYPKALFQGKLSAYNSESAIEQQVTAIGKLTIHGVTREVQIPGIVVTMDNKLIAKSKFIIHLKDYKIKIPKLLWQNIAEDVEVTVEFIYKPA
jgi:polyisoprenoid-binding protein YceI